MEKTHKIGTITIGQSPRTDITCEILPLLGDRFSLIEKGALDDLSLAYINEYIAPKENEEILVSRMKDGSKVTMSKDKVIPLLQQKIYELEKLNVDIIVLLCNDPFPDFKHETLLIKPESILHTIAAKLSNNKKVGVIMPDQSQLNRIKVLWSEYGIDTVAIAISPYDKQEIIESQLEILKNKEISLVFMECLGHSSEMKDRVMKVTNKPVILSRTMLFNIVKELF